jgi:hypothetical protein
MISLDNLLSSLDTMGNKVNNRRPGGTKRESQISKRTIFNFATKEISKDFGIFILHINWDNPCLF